MTTTVADGVCPRNLQAVRATHEKDSDQRMHLAHLQFTSAQGEDKRQNLVPAAKEGLVDYLKSYGKKKSYGEPNANKK
ncbi:hypothetical protein ACRRTK_006535 [Alexandromys fortis]